MCAMRLGTLRADDIDCRRTAATPVTVSDAPEEKQSGTKEWQRRIWGGRKDVRNALYMAHFLGLPK
jgi:hypothetical protein